MIKVGIKTEVVYLVDLYNPVNTGRLLDVFETSITYKICLKDVFKTSCEHWEHTAMLTINITLVFFCFLFFLVDVSVEFKQYRGCHQII